MKQHEMIYENELREKREDLVSQATRQIMVVVNVEEYKYREIDAQIREILDQMLRESR